MKPVSLFLIAISFIFFGCARTNDPVTPAPAPIVLVSQTQTPGWAQDIWVHDGTAYVADDEQGVTFWDVSNPQDPVLLDTLQTTTRSEGVAFAPLTNLLLVNQAPPPGGLKYYNPDTKIELGSIFDAGIRMFDFVELSADTIVIAEVDNLEGLKVFKLFWDSNRSEWIDDEISGWMRETLFRGFCFDFETAYIARNQYGIKIADIAYNTFSNDITPRGSVDTPGAARDIVLNSSKTHIIVADYQAGISIVDVTDKDNPVYVKSLLPEKVDQVFEVEAVGDTVYFLDNYNGIFATDVSDPLNPYIIGRYDTPAPMSIFVDDDNLIYVADEDLGMLILEWR